MRGGPAIFRVTVGPGACRHPPLVVPLLPLYLPLEEVLDAPCEPHHRADAERWVAANRAAGRRNRFTPRSGDEVLEKFLGRCAECAVARATGFPLWDHPEPTGAPDVGDLQVRYSRTPYLYLYPGNDPMEEYFLVTGAWPSFTIEGWRLGRDVMVGSNWHPGGDLAAWRMHRSLLHKTWGRVRQPHWP